MTSAPFAKDYFTRACRVRNRQSEPYREPRWTTKLRRFFP